MAITSLIIKIGAKDEEVQKALDRLGKQATTVEAELARLGTTPLGQATVKSIEQMTTAMKAVTDAQQKLADRAVAAARGLELVGGASKLTSDELAQVNRIITKGIDAFRALGQDAPPALMRIAAETKNATAAGQSFSSWLGTANNLLGTFGIGLSIGAVVSFGRDILAAADSLTKLRDKTGISIEGLQRFQIAGDDAGNSIDEVTTAIVKMSDNLVSGNASAVSALGRLGLNFETIMGLSPENQFIAISDAIREIHNPAEQVNIAIDLFGKTGATILPILKRGFDDLRKASVGMSTDTVESLDDVGDALTRASRSFHGEAANFITFAFLGWSKAARDAKREVDAFNGALAAIQTKGLPKLFTGLVPPGLPKDLDAIEQSLSRLQVTTKKHAAEVEKTIPLLAGVSLGFHKYTEDVSKLTAVVPDLSAHLETMSARFADVRDHMNDLASADITPMFSKLPNVVAQATKAIDEASTATETLGQKTSGLHDLAASFTQLAQISGDSFGGLVKDIAQVVAALDLVDQAADRLAKGGGLADFAIASVGALDQATKSTSRWKATLGGAATGMKIGASIAGPYGAAIGAAAGALVGFFRSAGAAEKAVNKLREEFVQTAGGLAALNARAAAAGVTLTAMLNAKNAEQYTKAINDLNAAFNVQADSTAALNEAIQRYGFSIEELGPALQRQELGKQAESIFRDWSVLNAAGIDTVAIATRMADSINTYVRQAVAMGIEVPAAMKPMLQSMIDQGLLTDAAGNKITDLNESGITFAQTMTEGFKKVVDAVTKLADAIAGRLGTAIAAIPTQVTVDVDLNAHWNIPERPRDRTASTGGLITATGVQRFASGGRVLPFLARGRDTVPAMLTPGEIVLNQSQQAAVGSALGGSVAVVAELQALRRELRTEIARSTRDAVQKVSRR